VVHGVANDTAQVDCHLSVWCMVWPMIRHRLTVIYQCGAWCRQLHFGNAIVVHWHHWL